MADPVLLTGAGTAGPAFRSGAAVATAFRVYRRGLPAFGLVALVFLAPAVLLDLAAPEADRLSQFAWTVLGCFVTAGITRGTLDLLKGSAPKLPRMLGAGLSRGFRVFGAGMIAVMIALLGLLLLVVPGLVAAAGLYLAEPATAAEDRTGPRAAIARSWALTRGHRLGLLGVATLFQAIPVAVAGSTGLLAIRFGDPGAARVMNLAGELLATQALALQAVAVAVSYHGLRTEKEGLEAPALATIFE